MYGSYTQKGIVTLILCDTFFHLLDFKKKMKGIGGEREQAERGRERRCDT